MPWNNRIKWKPRGGCPPDCNQLYGAGGVHVYRAESWVTKALVEIKQMTYNDMERTAIYFRFERWPVVIGRDEGSLFGRDGGSLIGRDGDFLIGRDEDIIFSANAL